MKQRQFEQLYRGEWRQLERQLARLEQRTGKADMGSDELADLPQRHRRLCHQLALARDRGYSLSLLQELDNLMLRAHRQLYRRQPPILKPLQRLVVHDFPARVRQQAGWHLASAAVFLGSLVLVLTLVSVKPDMVYAVMDPATVETSLTALLADADALAAMRGAPNPYGDGHAGERVAQAVAWRFGLADRPADWQPEARPTGPSLAAMESRPADA